MLEENNSIKLSYSLHALCDVKWNSKCINNKTYMIFIKYDAAYVDISTMKEYCCDCTNGLCTIGCYS